MLVITSGSKDEVKKEMKAAGKTITDELKAVRKDYRRVQNRPRWVRRKIEDLEDQQKIYMVSKVIPVKVGNVIINFLAYERFMKKIKRFTVRHTVGDHGLKVEYENRKKQKGHIVFFDLNRYFSDFERLPIAEVKEAVA